MRFRCLFATLIVMTVACCDRASAQVSFVDVTNASGLNFVGHIPMPPASPVGPSTWAGCGAAVADYNGDGHPDVYLFDSFGWPNQLFRNNGDKTFTNVTAESNLGHTGSGRVALMYDFDNDGDPDVVLAHETQGYSGLPPSQIYRNDNGVFVNVTAGSGFNPNSIILGGMAASDYDDDGLLDVYVTTWDVILGTPKNYLYRNLGGLRFEDVTQQVGLRVPVTSVQAWTPVFVDLDGDGDQDLFTAVDFQTNYYFRLDRSEGSPATFINQSFESNVFHCCSDTSGNDMGVAVGDIEGDGDLDIFTTNITLPPPNQMLRTNLLLVNHGLPTPFTDEAVDRGVWNSYWGWGTAFFDVDLDGDLDLYTVNGRSAGDGGYWSDRPAQLFINDGGGVHANGSGYFTESAAQAGVAHTGNGRAFIPFDYDGDGDLDLLITNVAQPVVLFENVSPRTFHWLGLKLVGAARNRDAIGAKINVRAAGGTQVRELIGGGSSYATLPLDAHFGLAANALADQVSITWPGGATTTLFNVPADRRLTIVEGAPPPPAVLVELVVNGPSTVSAGSTANFFATGLFHFTANSDVTQQASWSVSPSNGVSISANGVLSTGASAAGQSLTITARHGELSAVRTVSVVATSEPTGFSPVVTITQPTTLDTYSTSQAQISLAGTVITIGSPNMVAWSSNTGGGGSCARNGQDWNCGDISLAMGANVVTVSAIDDQDRTGTDQVEIHRMPFVSGRVVASPEKLEFGRDLVQLDLTLALEGLSSIGYKIVPSVSWLAVEPESGAIDEFSGPSTHRVHLVREALTPNVDYAGVLAIETNNQAVGVFNVEVAATGRDRSDPRPGQAEPPADDLDSNDSDGDGVGPSNPPQEPGQETPPEEPASQENGRPRWCGAMGTVWLLLIPLYVFLRPHRH